MTDKTNPMPLGVGAVENIAECVANARDSGELLDRAGFRQAVHEVRKFLADVEKVAVKLPRGACIAIIEDDLEMQRAIVRLAKTVGFTEIRTYSSAEDFVADTTGSAMDVPDALVTDWDLPGSGGSVVLQHLLNLHRTYSELDTFRVIHSARPAAEADCWSESWSFAVNVVVQKGDPVALKTTLGEAYTFALREIGRCQQALDEEAGET